MADQQGSQPKRSRVLYVAGLVVAAVSGLVAFLASLPGAMDFVCSAQIVQSTCRGLVATAQEESDQDRLNVESGGLVDTDTPVRLFGNMLDGALLGTEGPTTIAGPVLWRVVAYNPLNRAVTIRSIDVFYFLAGNRISYSEMRPAILDSRAQELVDFPVSIAAREGEAFTVAVNMPIRSLAASERTCLENEPDIHRLQECVFRHDRDLFGNAVVNEGGTTTMPGGFPPSPDFRVIVTSADGAQFPVTLSFYPGLEDFLSGPAR